MMLKPLIAQEEITRKVQQTAAHIRSDYHGKDLVVISVLKGAICFTADLIREIDLPLELQFVQCSSYGANGIKRGDLTIFHVDQLNISNKDVIVVDDIFDSGKTMSELIKALQTLSPRSIKSCVVLNKLGVEKVTSYQPDYTLFNIDDHFVVGYGLDYKEQYRNLPAIYTLMDPS